MKPVRLITTITLVVLVAASLVAAYLQRAPDEVARQHVSEHGIAVEKLALLGHRGSAMPVGAWETMEFQVKGAEPRKKLVVDLRQPVYFLPWRVVEFREEALP